jgi:hypothetical protein
MNRAGIRVFLAACAVLLMGIGAFDVRPTSAQGSEWTLELHAQYCPSDYVSGEGWDECTTPDPHLEMEFRVSAPEAQPEYFVTGEGGVGIFELDGAGLGSGFEVSLPVLVIGLELSCAKSDGSSVEVRTDPTHFIFPDTVISAGDYVTCDLYLIQAPNEVSDDGTIPTGGTVTLCTEAPEGEFGVWWVSPYCSAPSGVYFTLANAATGGSIYCEAEAADVPDPKAAGCSTPVPYSETILVTLDESTIPEGYQLVSPNPQEFTAPDSFPDGRLSHPFFMLLPIGTDAPDDLEEQAQSTAVAEVVEEVPAVEGRTVVLYSGDCDTIGDEVATLNDVLPEDGDVVGDEKAIKAEMSNTLGALFFLDAAIDEGMALVVYEDETTDTPIACGELGGVNTHDGMLPIGLGEVDDSGFVGTAVLSYNDVDETTTDVTIVISEELLPEPTGTPNS